MMTPIVLLLLLLQKTLKQIALQIMIIIVPIEGEGERLEIYRFSINTIILKYIPVLPLMYYRTNKKSEKTQYKNTTLLTKTIPHIKHYVHTDK